MYKGKHIILFVGLFILLVAAPLIVNFGNASAAPEPNVDTPAINALDKKECVESAEYMRSSHMQLLDSWRNDVVRDGATEYTGANGQVYEISLDDTCLACHTNREEFCDSCHEYSSVELYCWDCHDLADAEQVN
ncbi:sulfate reduction electron transfer complex DsrMKJOP subunit DsrJ [Eggerthella sinensis]|jgi:hypothetical protein|uniref:Menaquinol oxidoreductase n=1 Tax=Eggerthella sinensis TaxID=242230 RepID=A0A3N0IU92_9ACTN|nr:sulfate reduction electron transfer complex DsrMKJOP subunit DsrJ [Eggerthella sinensis]MCB7038770.1 sulfate reduction electron transfer complex DsrMKJOP subunit DsrJ [Eggerthella sinensis]RDB68103.1 menaquinol oxidoreductase [Eggerthella sinensis]RNM40569.1 menaquinol oxidoreductase [Eggerthella sinensis]